MIIETTIEKTPQQEAVNLVQEIAQCLYDSNGTASGSKDVALLAVSKIKEAVETNRLWKHWDEVEYCLKQRH